MCLAIGNGPTMTNNKDVLVYGYSFAFSWHETHFPFCVGRHSFYTTTGCLFRFLCWSIMCLYVLSSVLWCPLRFPYKNDVRFVFTSSCLYVICVCLHRVVSNTCCVVFLFCLSSSYVPYVASFSGLSIFDYPFGLTFNWKMGTLFYFISIPTVSFECFLGGSRILLCFSSFIYCLFQSRKVISHISTCVRDIDFVSVTRYNDFSVSFWNYPDSVVIFVSPLVVRYNV